MLNTYSIFPARLPAKRLNKNAFAFAGNFLNTMLTALVLFAAMTPIKLFAQAPLPSYSGPQNYVINTAITPLSPSNSGGAVAAPGYSSSRTTVFSGTSYSGPMARDAAGNIYTTDFSAPSDVLLVKISAVPGTPNITLQDHVEFARDLIMDAAGNLYAAEAGGIYKWTPGSTSGSLISSFQAADGIAIDASGNIYATTYAPGSFITEIAAGSGQQTYFGSGLAYDTGIAIDAAGNLYVCDNGTSSIIKIAAGTQTLTTVASGLANNMNDMVCDNAGNLFFSEANSTGVLEILAGTGTPVAVGSHYSAPYGIKPDASGNLYILDNGSLYKIAPVGGYFISPALPAGLSFNGTTGAISGTPTAVSAATNYTITGWNSSGHNAATVNIAVVSPPLLTYSGPQNYTVNTVITPLYPSNSGGAVAAPGYSSSKSTIFSGTSYVVFDRDASGNLYAFDYSNTSNKKLVKLSSTGSVLATYLTFLSSPEDIQVDAAGNIFALDASTLYKITSGGTVSTLSSTLFNANGLALDAADNVYVAEYNTSLSSVIEVPADGSSMINIGSGLSFMTDAAVDAAGNVYVCNDGDASIKEIPAGGGSMITIASGFTSFSTSDLTNIIVDGVGDIFFTERNGSKVSEIPAGTNTPVLISSGYFAPAGLALDLAGNLYIGDNGSLYKVAPVGGYFISPALPAGLSFDTTTGIISGTPTALSATTNYDITASNSSGSHTTQVSITVSNTPPSTDAKLSGLTIQHGTLSPSFDPVTFAYTVNLPNSITGVTLVPTLDDANATMVTFGGAILSGATSASVPLAVGTNTDHIIVTAADGVTKNVYAISFVRADTVLTAVSSIAAAGSTTTNTSAVNYTVTFVTAVSGLAASNFSLQTTGAISGAGIGTPSTADGGTTWTVPVTTGTGDGTIVLEMTSGAGLTPGISTALPFAGDTYTIDKTAPLANTLVYASSHSGNQLIAGQGDVVTLSFTTSETIQVPTVTIGGHAVTAVNSSGNNWSASHTVTNSDPPGRLHFSTTFTDLAGNSTPYDDVAAGDDIEVVSNIATLAGLTTSNSRLAPGFTPAKTSYKLTVGDIDFFTLTPTATDPAASITVNGTTVASGSVSQGIPLVIGDNPVTIVVASADNSTVDTYTITVTRKPSTNANLSNLRISNTHLSPAFNKDITSYTASVGLSKISVAATPVAAHATALILVNGEPVTSGTASDPITLGTGIDTITAVVTAQDSITTKTYTVLINHQSANANLRNIKLSKGTLSPVFRQADTSYTAEVDNSVLSITIKPFTGDSTATVTVNGTPVASGTASLPIALNVGPDTIKVTGLAANGTNTKTYTIIVTRDGPAPENSIYQPISVVNPANSPLIAENITVRRGISPNGDGMNDVLVIDGITAYPDNKLSIMSRNGELVFEATGYDNSAKAFDGHSSKNGKMQSPGTYFYALDYKVAGVTKHKTGFIVLKY